MSFSIISEEKISIESLFSKIEVVSNSQERKLGLMYRENGIVKKIQIYPKKSKSMNLAFDVTPAKYISGLITEKGICEASEKGLKELFK